MTTFEPVGYRSIRTGVLMSNLDSVYDYGVRNPRGRRMNDAEWEAFGGWALCLGSVNLYDVLPLCPPDVRVCAWVKSFAVFRPNVNPAYAWEPVIIRNPRTRRSRTEDTVRDWVSARITLRKGLVGAKPVAFNLWIIALLGVTENDTLDDLFPGTEGLMTAWGASIQELLFVS